MAGEWPQETGQRHGQDRVSLERHDEARFERENQARKRQPVLTLSGGKPGNRVFGFTRPGFSHGL
jgi:hypothetical protein